MIQAVIVKMQAFLRDGDAQICRHGNPYLRLDGVLAGAKEQLDAQVLHDPFKEQRQLQALATKIGNKLGLQAEIARELAA